MALGSLSVLGIAKRAFAQNIEDCPSQECPPLKPPSILSEISNNHGHEILVPFEDVIKGTEKSYSIKGKSSHPHTVQITEEIFSVLRTQNVVEIVSTVDAGHSHVVKLIREEVI